MKINDAFPSKFIKAPDLQGARIKLVIDAVEMQTIGQDQKVVVKFVGKSKGLVLNKTNAVTISEIAGSDDTDQWLGVAIVIYPTQTNFQGKRVDAIRVDWPPDAVKPKLVDAADNDIPF